jgi:predicted  nucleic acid-binding Zn-ribbon protein
MDEKKMSKQELEKQLSGCEVRIAKIRGHERASQASSELDGIEEQVNACRLELDKVQEDVDEWADAELKVVKSLDSLRSRVDRARKMVEFVR